MGCSHFHIPPGNRIFPKVKYTHKIVVGSAETAAVSCSRSQYHEHTVITNNNSSEMQHLVPLKGPVLTGSSQPVRLFVALVRAVFCIGATLDWVGLSTQSPTK